MFRDSQRIGGRATFALAILAIFMLLLQVPLAARAAESQRLTAAAVTTPVLSGVPRLGVQTDNFGDVPLSTEFGRSAGLGARSVLFPVHWRLIEPNRTTPPTYDFSAYDAQFAAVKSRGLVPLVVVDDNPTWAYSGDRKLLTEQGRIGLGQFMKALVQKYGDTNALWSLYNEPDCSGATVLPGEPPEKIPSTCWGNAGNQYAAMLKEVYPKVKEANPNALVLIGGIAYDRWGTDFAERFLDDVLGSGGGDFFDVMNFHYYTEFADKWAPFGKDIIGKTRAIQSKLAEHNLNKPIVVSEISKHGGSSATEETVHARYVIQANARALFAGSSLNIWFNLRDDPSGANDGKGLLRGDASEKLGAQAFKTLSSRFAGFTPAGAEQPPVSSGIEAYTFKSSTDDRQRLTIAWTDSVTQTQAVSPTIQFHAASATVGTRTGSTQVVTDGGDGQADGIVSIALSPEPVLITYTEPLRVLLPFVVRNKTQQ